VKHYIGIDLGTTNSAICSYDGNVVRVWKSPEQNDVTPSAIFIDRRGNRYYGRRAYELAPANGKNAATLFKRYVGTSQKFDFENAKLSLTPEECSAEILKILFGYLPEEIRDDPDIATVITVPAAFNQMKKDATLEAARLAGIGSVALMQEPVAAVMSVMRVSKQEGVFLVYDLGGGTFDVSIAENIGGKVNLLTQGGKEMCGSRDWDRMIWNHIIVPWLHNTFSLPYDLVTNPQYKPLHRLALFAAEQAKIELSTQEETTIRMDEGRLRSMDQNGEEIYIDIPITRAALDPLIVGLIADTISVTRDTLKKAGLSASDIEKIVFVGGPTNYKPLRDKVATELALSVSTNLNPMTAVAEGASIFAESIDWTNQRHNRKSATAEMTAGTDIAFRYEARTTSSTARIAFTVSGSSGLTVEITSADTGWSSGRIAMKQETMLDLPLEKNGENIFDVAAFDAFGKPLTLNERRIVITKTIATIGAIPASHSIAIKALDKLGGTPVPVYLVQEGDALPKKGREVLRAGQTLKAGSHDALIFTLWEGEITYPIEDNRFIGYYKISGTDFETGMIPTGAEIICDYDMNDSGNIHLCVSIPCIGADFGDRSFYSRQEGQINLADTDRIADAGQDVMNRIDTMSEKINDERLDKAREKASKATSIGSKEHDQEDAQSAYNELLEAKKELASVRKDHLKEIRQMDLDSCVKFFNEVVRQYAKPSESEAFDNLSRAAQRSIERNDADFDNQLNELRGKNFAILWRQDWFVIDRFNWMVQNPYNFSDRTRFEELQRTGQQYIQKDQIEGLRSIFIELSRMQITESMGENMFDEVNVIKG
jgi:molecular chaperone DnaK